MNYRVLFVLSIIVICVGIGGIYMQNKQSKIVYPLIEEKKEIENTIMVAEALRDLHRYDILTADDYKLTSLKISSSINDSRDISSISSGDIHGALIKNNVSKGMYLTPEIFVLSNSPDFASSSLRPDELPYSLKISSPDDYLLSAIKGGDRVSLFIRVIEIDKSKTSNVGLVPEGSVSASRETPKYSIIRLFRNLTILGSKRYEKNDKEKNKYNLDKEEEFVGEIMIRLNQLQLAKLMTVEKTGEIFLLPEGSDNQKSVSKMRMDDVLPQFRSVKELRGGK